MLDIMQTTDREYWTSFTGNEFNRKAISRSRLQSILSSLITQNDKIVNLMCGRFAHVHSHLGVDIVEHLLRANTEIDDYLVWDMNDSLQHYPIQEETFDVAVMISGISYLRHPEHTFLETGRILKPRGKFIVGFDHNQTMKGTEEWKRLNDEQRLERVQQLYDEVGFGQQEVISSLTAGMSWIDIKGENFYIVTALKR